MSALRQIPVRTYRSLSVRADGHSTVLLPPKLVASRPRLLVVARDAFGVRRLPRRPAQLRSFDGLDVQRLFGVAVARRQSELRGPVDPNGAVVSLHNVRVAAVVAESLNPFGRGVDLTSTRCNTGKSVMNALTGTGRNGPKMVQKLRYVLLGLVASTAPLSAQICRAKSPTNVIPQRRAPQAFLVQDAPPIADRTRSLVATPTVRGTAGISVR